MQVADMLFFGLCFLLIYLYFHPKRHDDNDDIDIGGAVA